MALPTEANIDHLDEHGWCVVRSVADEDTCGAVRTMIEELLGPPAETIDAAARGYQTYETVAEHGQDWKWPRVMADEGGAPIIRTNSHLHWVEHPIADARAAAAVPAMAPAMAKLLRCTDAENDLKLIHQNFRRTDPSPGPYPEYVADGVLQGGGGKSGPGVRHGGFHMVRRCPRPAARLAAAARLLNRQRWKCSPRARRIRPSCRSTTRPLRG